MDKTTTRVYVKELLLALGAYLLVLVASIALLKASHGSGWWRIPVALTPVVPVVAGMLVVVRAMRRMNEPQRLVQLEALAFAGTAILTLGYGFLEGVAAPHLRWTFVWPLMGTLWVLGLAIAKRRARRMS